MPTCIYSLWHGVIPRSYFIFNDFYTCHTQQCVENRGVALYNNGGRGEGRELWLMRGVKLCCITLKLSECQANVGYEVL